MRTAWAKGTAAASSRKDRILSNEWKMMKRMCLTERPETYASKQRAPDVYNNTLLPTYPYASHSVPSLDPPLMFQALCEPNGRTEVRNTAMAHAAV